MSDDVLKKLLGDVGLGLSVGRRATSLVSSATGISDRQAIVMDIGSQLTKIGFAGEETPRAIIPTKVQHNGRTVGLLTPAAEEDPQTLEDCLHGFLHKVYSQHLLVKSHEHKVHIVRTCISRDSFYDAVKDVLTTIFRVPEVVVRFSHEVALYGLGSPSALFFSCGQSSAYAMAVAQTYEVTKSLRFCEKGAATVMRSLETQLTKDGSEHVDHNDLEDIFVRACFATHPPEGVRASTISYDNGERDIQITHDARVHSADTLFTFEDDASLQSLLADALLACPIAHRKEVAGRIVLLGGTCHMKGFKHRLLEELQKTIQDSTEYEPLRGLQLGYLKTPFQPSITEWIGASIAATLSTTR